MNVGQVKFVGAIGAPGGRVPADLPQIAIGGRSNVGKSSLINHMLGRKSLARVSRQPGRTQQINFFSVDDRFLLADLPGYGFARAPEEIRRSWQPLVESYLESNPLLLGVILLVDCRRGLLPEDRRMVDHLAEMELPILFALTKIDKLNREGRKRAVARLRDELDVPEDQVLATSARTGEGRESLRTSLQMLVDSYVEEVS